MPFVLGKLSRSRLETVEPPLRRVVERAIQLTKCDFIVLEGVRSQNRQYELFAQGRTVDQLRRAGVPLNVLAQPGKPKVTWTLTSKHFPDPKTGLSKAVDLAPFPIDWNDLKKFNEIARAMEEAADQLGIDICWGADWDDDGKPRERGETDSPHFQLKR